MAAARLSYFLRCTWKTMDDVTNLSLEAFLDQTAERTPTPGGGSVTALAGALACALARMVAAYSISSRSNDSQRAAVDTVAGTLFRADQLMRALVTQDSLAYERLTAARGKMRKNPSAQAEYEEAVLAAVSVPMEMAAIAGNVLAVLDEFKAEANRRLLSDLAIAALLAEATAGAARYTVHVNVLELHDSTIRQKTLADIGGITERCAAHRRSIESYVSDYLQNGEPGSR